jgi:transcriptional regulator with XRE-family HTH domain
VLYIEIVVKDRPGYAAKELTMSVGVSSVSFRRGTNLSIKERVGPAIRRYRKEAGLSVRELAKRLDVTEGSIRHYETGRQLPPIDRLEEIAEVLEISPFLLLADESALPLLERLTLAVDQLPAHDLQMISDLLSRLTQD